MKITIEIDDNDLDQFRKDLVSDVVDELKSEIKGSVNKAVSNVKDSVTGLFKKD